MTGEVPVYRGDEDYVFVCYAHADREFVLDELAWLHDRGVRFWYDEGISAGTVWRAEIAEAIERASAVLFYVSAASLASDHCNREVNYSIDEGKKFVPVRLDDAPLTADLRVGLTRVQWLERERLGREVYQSRLLDALYANVAVPSDSSLKPSSADSPSATIEPKDHRFRTAVLSLVVLVGLCLLVYGIVRYTEHRSMVIEANRQGIPQVKRLADDGRYREALELGLSLQSLLPEDEQLPQILNRFSKPGTILSAPEGAAVQYRAYEEPERWANLGRTPVGEVRLPHGILVVRLTLPDQRPTTLVSPNPGWLFRNDPAFVSAIPELQPPADSTQVLVEAFEAPIFAQGFEPGRQYNTGRFHIDRLEVTNGQFQEFVDAGAYEELGYWSDLEFETEGEALSWAEAMLLFVDATGDAGPATWEFGRYPAGQESWPVSGVSWYEAIAYARFKGRSLPTRYHWARAASDWDVGPAIIAQSNFGGEGPTPGGQYHGVGPFGTYDMFGNVREWVINPDEGRRTALGGAWSDPRYMSVLHHSLPPMDRSAVNGFRTVEYLDDDFPDFMLDQVVIRDQDYASMEPVGDEAFRSLVDQFDYESTAIEGRLEDEVEDRARGWRRETVRISSSYIKEGFKLYLYIPENATPPYQTVVYLPGMNAVFNPQPSGTQALLEGGYLRSLDFVISSGRVLAWPIYHATYERNDQLYSGGLTQAEYDEKWRVRIVRWRSDMGEVIDYLGTRVEFDSSSISLLGYSLGGIVAPQVLAIEDRLSAAIIIGGGTIKDTNKLIGDNVHFLPRVHQPVLLLSGEYDYTVPLASQKRYFELLGSETKLHKTFKLEHGYPDRNTMMTHGANWLDTHVGLVD